MSSAGYSRRVASVPSAALARRALSAQREWWIDHLSPSRNRIRTVGMVRAAPTSLGLLLASLAATASVRLPSPAQHAAKGIFVYYGRDLHTATALYRLPLSALLAQSWSQWMWTAFVAVALFAPLEARVGPARLLLCVFAGQVLSTAVVDLVAGAGDRTAQLAAPDIGTSCLVVSAAAGYAWVTRSRLLTSVLAVGLCVDAVLSAPPTAMEHWVAAGSGLLFIAVRAPKRRQSSGFSLPVSVRYCFLGRSGPHAVLWW
jgi:membrane associated rhomboid family serine protease